METGRRGFWALAVALLLPGVVCLIAPGTVRGWMAGAPRAGTAFTQAHPDPAPADAAESVAARAYERHVAQSRRFESAMVFLTGLLYTGLVLRWLAGRAAAGARRRRDAAFAMHMQTLLDGVRRVESTTSADALPPLLDTLAAVRRRAEADWQRGRLSTGDLVRLFAVYQASGWPAAQRQNRLLHEELLERGEALLRTAPPRVSTVEQAPAPPVAPQQPPALREEQSVAPVSAPKPALPPRERLSTPVPPAPTAPPVVAPPPRAAAISVPPSPPRVETAPARPPVRADHITEGIIGEPVLRSRRTTPEPEAPPAPPPAPASAARPSPEPEPEPEPGRKRAAPPRPAAQTAPRKKGKQRLRKKQEKARHAERESAPDDNGGSRAAAGRSTEPGEDRQGAEQMGFEF